MNALARFVVIVGAALATVSSAAMADAVSDFYSSHPIKMIVGYSPGGGVDTYSRMLARHMGEHIPGNPKFIVQNLPGAGSMKAVKSLLTVAKDGTYIVAFNPGNITRALSEPKKIGFNFKDVAYLGSISAESQICYMWHTTGVTTFDQLIKRDQVNMGATSPTTSAYMMGAIVRNMFGAKIKHVLGYPGRAEEHIAIERGELDGGCGTWDSTPKHWFDKKEANVIVRLTRAVPADMPKGSPYIGDFASADQKKVLSMVLSVNDMFRPYIVAKETPPERLKALQDAFMKTVTGEPFLADAKKARRTVQSPMPGTEVTATVEEIYSASPEIITKAAAAVK